jgi:hypothetical protein
MLSERSRNAFEDTPFMGACKEERWSFTALPPPTLDAGTAMTHKCALLARIGAEITPRVVGTGSLPAP